MKAFGQVALLTAIVVIVSLSFNFAQLSPGAAKFFAYFGVAFLPTLIMQFATAKSVKEGQIATFVFECILNVFAVLTGALIFLGIVFKRL